MSRTPALELYDWIARAESLGLLATIDELAALPLGEPVPMIAPEYTHFCLQMDPECVPGFDPRLARPPTEFFAALRGTFTRRGEFVDGSPGDPKAAYPCLRAERDLLGEEFEMGVYACPPSRLAESGSGDGGTHYMLWGAVELGGLPDVYVNPHRVDVYDDPDRAG